MTGEIPAWKCHAPVRVMIQSSLYGNIKITGKKKQYFKAALCSFILDTKNKKFWDIGDVQHLRGQLSYYTMIEKEYFEKIIVQQNRKWNVNVKEMFKAYLSGTIS